MKVFTEKLVAHFCFSGTFLAKSFVHGGGSGAGGYRRRGETDGQMEEKAKKEVEERGSEQE